MQGLAKVSNRGLKSPKSVLGWSIKKFDAMFGDGINLGCKRVLG